MQLFNTKNILKRIIKYFYSNIQNISKIKIKIKKKLKKTNLIILHTQ